MTRDERIAITRIISDLIKADRIVDTGEIEFWKKICGKYGITKEIQVSATSISFAKALNCICSSETEELKTQLLADCREMTVSDGFCAHSEALLIISLAIMLDPASGFFGEVYSIPRASFNIDIATALYIENFHNEETNRAIRENYRSIFKELQLAGFHFIYIPKIIEHYRDTDPALFKHILSFLSPSTSKEGLDYIYNSLMEMTTGRFCKDILCNKCDITELRNTVPSLLIKIGNSFVGDEPYANYLRIEVDQDILKTVQDFADRFCDMLSSDIYVVNTSEERDNQFHFHGFYKQLLDIFMVRRNIRSRVVIDPYKSKISFPDIDSTAEGLTRRDRALYTLLLCYGNSGLDFVRPENRKEMERYDRRIQQIQKRYGLVYEIFGGKPEDAPDLTTARLSMISHIRTAIKKLSALYNQEDYSVTTSDRAIYTVHLEQDAVFVSETGSDEPVALAQSELYRRVMDIK
ncbi:MAG: hypothetical protein K2H96_04045 [Muribaculaceae bacterium]|nr:hypothetical protein [Muribaculaceae bacterium]